jgi:LysR family transcriptional regulator, transcriptional activator for dmlA
VDSVSDLEFFRFIVKQGNLSAAAQVMGVTPPAVSRRLAALERRLGVRLVHRTARSMIVTAEGERYVDEGSRILDDIEDLEQTVASGQAAPRGLLRVNAPFEFGRRHLPPAISEFARGYSEIETRLMLTDRPMNPVEHGFDLVIRIGDMPDTRLIAQKLSSNRRFLCAAPSYVSKHGAPAVPRDLQRHNFIIVRQGDATYGTLHLSTRLHEETVKLHGTLSSNDSDVALAWALDGHGILMVAECDVAPHIRSGTLCEILPTWSLPSGDIFATYLERVSQPARVKAFVQFLSDRFSKKSANGATSAVAW